MTQEEKAKRYDNIIEKANKMHSENCEACQICIEELIPELAESEDEGMRKEIINYFEHYPNIIVKRERKNDWIAWLEKQGEQPQGKSALEAANEVKVDNANKVEPRQEELTEFEKAVKQVMEEAIECGDTHNLKADADMLLSLVQKPAWSEEDEEKRKRIMHRLSLDGTINNKDLADINDWLKSLRPQKRWKPSDEQMKFLWKYAEQNNYDGSILTSLYNDLKKLRGE